MQPTSDPSSRVCKERLVKVAPDCDLGEYVCSNGVECSVDQQCLSDIRGNVNTLTAGDEATTEVQQVPEPPILQLVGPSFVRLPRGTIYRKCDPEDTNDVPSDTNFCDPGAIGIDKDFDFNNVTMTEQVSSLARGGRGKGVRQGRSCCRGR